MPIFLKQVSKSFVRKAEVGFFKRRAENREVLKTVNLQVAPGETVCVLGKNGSGKTTLIRILSTLIEPDSGEASVCGFDLLKQSNEVRRRIGVMLNAGDGGFHPRLSGSSNLEYYAALYRIPSREARARIATVLDDLGLGDRGADQYQSYSSGMRRRLALARALLPSGGLLLLDEPTLGVDPWSTEQIHNHLAKLSNEGEAILCATNSIGEARRLARRVYLLEDGALSELSSSKIEEAASAL